MIEHPMGTTAVRTTCGLITLADRRPAGTERRSKDERHVDTQVYVFPLCRRVGLVRTLAAALAARDYGEGRRLWSSHVRKVRIELGRCGFDRSELESELRQYAAAVSHALRIQQKALSRFNDREWSQPIGTRDVGLQAHGSGKSGVRGIIPRSGVQGAKPLANSHSASEAVHD